MLKNNKLQTILYVKDMASEVHFYQDVLGLSIQYPHGLKNYAGEMWVEFNLGESSLALHGGAAGAPDDLHEVVFWVEDIEQARRTILDAGIHINKIRTLEDSALIAEGLDPEGHRFAIRTTI
jgi:predicted enzyme related to lactoylglutathione lyase